MHNACIQYTALTAVLCQCVQSDYRGSCTKHVVAVTTVPLNTNVAADSNRKCKFAGINLPEGNRWKVHLITFQFLYLPKYFTELFTRWRHEMRKVIFTIHIHVFDIKMNKYIKSVHCQSCHYNLIRCNDSACSMSFKLAIHINSCYC